MDSAEEWKPQIPNLPTTGKNPAGAHATHSSEGSDYHTSSVTSLYLLSLLLVCCNTSSSANAERLRCRVGQFWPKVED